MREASRVLTESGVNLLPEQREKLLDAREAALNASDKLHSVAAELVGDLKGDGGESQP
jgi:hypothetical protein